MMPFIDIAAQQSRIRADLDRRLARVLEHGKYILGPEVAELEDRLAHFVGVKHCVTCANGTDALQIALMAVGVGVGDEVITPAFSYIAAAESVALLGATPVFADVNPDSFLVEAAEVERLISPRTKAIIPVSLYGQCADMDAINTIADTYGIVVIEDAAQSFGATHKGKRSGSLSDIACTSFFPSKPLGCYGDGGALFTDNEDLATIMRQIARHGQDRKYHHIRVGLNSRLDTIQAAVLLAKFDIFEADIIRRNAAAEAYAEALSGAPLKLPAVSAENTSVWAQYTIVTSERDNLSEMLKKSGIPTVVYYPVPLHLQPAFSSGGVCPISEELSGSVLSLPMHPDLSLERVSFIAERIIDVLQ